MRKFKLASLLRSLAYGGCIGLGLLSLSAQAYETKTVFQTEHFAINQVILGEHEPFDGPIQSSITGDIQALNRLNKLYQSTTVIFPAGSQGYTGKINTPIEGVLTISNYDSGKDRIFLNRNAKFMTQGGLYIDYTQLVEMINQRYLNKLIGEFKSIPLVLTNVPVSATGFDPTMKGFYVTSVSDATIIDTRIDDSVFYPKDDYYKLHKNCKVEDLLLFTDRIVPNIPLFISGRSALNRMECGPAPEAKEQAPEQAQ